MIKSWEIKTLRDLEQAEAELSKKFSEFHKKGQSKGSIEYKYALKDAAELRKIRDKLEADAEGRELVKPVYITNLIKKSLGYEVYVDGGATSIRGYHPPGTGDFKVSRAFKDSDYYTIEIYGKNSQEKAYKITELLTNYGFDTTIESDDSVHCSISYKL